MTSSSSEQHPRSTSARATPAPTSGLVSEARSNTVSGAIGRPAGRRSPSRTPRAAPPRRGGARGPRPPARRRRRPRAGRRRGRAPRRRLSRRRQRDFPQRNERAGRVRHEALDLGRQDLVAVALVQPHPRRLLEQDPRDLLVDRHARLGVGLGQTLGEQLVQLRRRQPADVLEVGAGDEVAGVRRVRVGVGVVLRQRRVEVGGQPAVDVDVGLELHELEVDADLGELGLQVLGDVDVRLALAGDDDRLDREPVRVAAVGEQLAGELLVGAVARQARRTGRWRRCPRRTVRSARPSPSNAVSISSWRSIAHEIAWRTSRSCSGPRELLRKNGK